MHAGPSLHLHCVNPLVATGEGFVSLRDCRALIGLAEGRLRPAESGAEPGSGTRTLLRTNSVAGLPLAQYPMLRPLVDKLARVVGLPPENAEPLGVLRYAPGEAFGAHPDAMHLDGGPAEARLDATGGQRLYTTMIYLNDVTDGGATAFPRLGFTVAPKARRLLVVANTLAGGRAPTEAALHAGEPVGVGEKWVAVTWWRQRAYRRAA